MKNTELFPLSSEQTAGKDMQKIIQQYTRYWHLFIASVLICAGITYLYIHYFAVPQFKIYSNVLIKDDKNEQSSFNVSQVGDQSKSQPTNIDNEIEVFKSISLMTRVIKELGIANNYYTVGRLHNTELFGNTLPIRLVPNHLYSSSLNKTIAVYIKPGNNFELIDNDGSSKSYQFGQQIKHSYGTFTIVQTAVKVVNPIKILIKLQDDQQVASHYNHMLSVQPVNRNTSILQVMLVDAVPGKAELIINKLIDVYKKEAYEDKNAVAASTIKFLDNRLRYIASDLSNVEKNVEKYKSTNGLIDLNTQAGNYTEQASKYNDQLSEHTIQLDVLESIEKYLNSASNNNSTVPSTLGIDDEVLVGLINRFNELQLDKDRLARTTQPDNPLLQNVKDQLATLRTSILEDLRNVKSRLRITTNNLKTSSSGYQNKIKKLPGMERELLEINRQTLIKQNVYSYLLQKREEAALSLAATTSVARTIDPAIINPQPVNLNSQVLYLMAIILGLGMPFAGIYVSNILNGKVQSQQDVISGTRVPIIGEIAHTDEKGHIVTTSGNRTAVAESFRLVRANLGSVTGVDTKCLTLLVTSGTSGEGKTFFSMNLSNSLVLTGKRVALLNLDLHNTDSAIEAHLATSSDLGITDYLADDSITIEDIIKYSDIIPGLAVVSAKPTVVSHIELITSRRVNYLINQLKNRFDYIIIDTPPVGLVADAFALNTLVDFTIYLVRYGYTPKAMLSVIEGIHTHKTLNFPLIVLNDAKSENDNIYGYNKTYKKHRDVSKIFR
jgi:tyrosine-protein kinase Etk/Wzc